ncbi:MAG: lipid-A-disaccharide synthase [Candidatus Omnitrophota bacterium]|nr:lipid-A-disaccharide synthase [Candidatus Omnitrophota bacterium]
MTPKKIIIVAGEASSDMHAANLVKAIKDINPNTEFFGLGGKGMEQAGVKLLYNLVDLAVVGFVEVLKNIGKIKYAFCLILEKAKEIKPDAAILVDYPGFNLRLAKELKKINIKVIYYISPQIWAWGLNRVKLIKKVVDKMLVLFKFEEELYKRHGIDVLFVGHPFLDIVKPSTTQEEFLEANDLSKNKLTIALMPGSRTREVETLLLIMLKSANLIQKDLSVQFIIIKSPTIPLAIFERLLNKTNLSVKVIENKTYDCINACDFVIVASGSATLEVAILQKPMVIIYKVSFFTWAFLKFMLKIPYVGLVNVVAQDKIVPECLQFEATPKMISGKSLEIITSPERINQIKKDLAQIKECLGKEGASLRAANEIVKLIN